MKVTLNLLMLLLPLYSMAQNTLFDKPVKEQLDSISAVLANSTNDTLRMSAYRDLHFYYSELNRDTALYFAGRQLKLSQQLHQRLWEASAWESIGYVTQIMGDYPRSFIALSNALKIAEDQNSENNIWDVRRFSKDGNARHVRFYNLTATHILFAFLYLGTGNPQKAFASFDKGIQSSEQADDKVGLVAAYANYGNACLKFNKPDSAFILCNKAIGYLDESDLSRTNPPFFSFEKGNCLNTLAEVNIIRNNFPAAKNLLHEAAQLCQDENSLGALVNIYLTMSSLYRTTGELDSSEYFARLSLQRAKLLGSPAAVENASNSMSESLMSLGKTGEAYRYLLLAKKLGDSINNRRIDNVTQYQAVDFNERLRLAEVEKNNLKLQSNVRMYTMLAGLAVFLIISILLYRTGRVSTRANRQLESLNADLANKNNLLDKRNAENELLLKEIHHRVKNNLEIVSSLLALQSAQISDVNIKNAMEEGQRRVHSIGIIHQRLYQAESPGAIEMKGYFKNLGESILYSFGADDRISVELPMQPIDVDIDTAVPLGLIVNELMTNAIKYAFPGNRPGIIRIKLDSHSGNALHLEVCDNGVGKPGITLGTGFGGQLIALLTRQLDGVMNEENNNGTHLRFDFISG